ncbi:oligosaccharide flippase family protein [bacterium]|nr:oligosaccharide flippase family protein [bacterium]
MLGNIIRTTGTKIFDAFLRVIILFLITNNLATHEVGDIAIILLSIGLLLMFNNFISGSLIYYTAREDVGTMLKISYLWVIVVTSLLFPIAWFFEFIHSDYTYHVIILCFLFSITSINQNILLGKQRVVHFNLVTILQPIVIVITLCIEFFLLDDKSLGAYITALFFAYITVFVVSSIFIVPYFRWRTKSKLTFTFVKMLKYGVWIRVGNLLQLLNDRISYFLIEFFLSKSALGIFSSGTQLGEKTIMLVTRSISSIQYAKISNTNDISKNAQITLLLAKGVFFIGLFGLLIINSIPVKWLVLLLSEKFADVDLVILSISPGLLFFNVLIIISHFISGIGKPKICSIGSAVSLFFTGLFCIILIPLWGLKGAGAAYSIGTVFSLAYMMIMFLKFSSGKWSDFLVSKADIVFFRHEIVGFIAEKVIGKLKRRSF